MPGRVTYRLKNLPPSPPLFLFTAPHPSPIPLPAAFLVKFLRQQIVCVWGIGVRQVCVELPRTCFHENFLFVEYSRKSQLWYFRLPWHKNENRYLLILTKIRKRTFVIVPTLKVCEGGEGASARVTNILPACQVDNRGVGGLPPQAAIFQYYGSGNSIPCSKEIPPALDLKI